MISTEACLRIGAIAVLLSFSSASARTQATSKDAEHPLNSPANKSNPISRDTFEVASVRLSPPNSGFVTINDSGSSRFSAHAVTMRLLVSKAYGLSSSYNITGAPGWFDDQPYEVDAKMEGDAQLSPEDFQKPLQRLLKERFHLAAHPETVFRSGYDLVTAKAGQHMTPAQVPGKGGYILENGMRFESLPMGAFASVLSAVLGSPVANKTGIAGNFAIDLHYARHDATDPDLPSIFTALEEDLGLKLVPEKRVPVEVLVIDHADRIPTEN